MRPDATANRQKGVNLCVRAGSAAAVGGIATGGLIGFIVAGGNGPVAVVTTTYGAVIGLIAGLVSVTAASLMAKLLSRLIQGRLLLGAAVSVTAGLAAAAVVAGVVFSLPPNSGGLENLIWLSLVVSTILAGVVYLILRRACTARYLNA